MLKPNEIGEKKEDSDPLHDKIANLTKTIAENKQNVEDQAPDATGSKKKKKNRRKKNKIPVKDISEDYPDGIFPRGEIIVSTKMHGTYNEEAQEAKDAEDFERINSLRKAAQAHIRTRQIMAPKMQPGTDLATFCTELENTARAIIKENKLEAGLAFPTGVSVNECAAHYTPDIDEKVQFKKGDIISIDFGIHVNGYLVDCAFTINTDPIYETLRQSTIEATNEALKLAGPDSLISDISARIEEVISSYEVAKPNGDIVQVKPVANLSGHQIDQYIIHAGKSVGLVRSGGRRGERMQSGEQYAIETFASTGKGIVLERGSNSHFMAIPGRLQTHHSVKKVRDVLGVIKRHHGTLAFCQRFLMKNCPPEITSGSLNSVLNILSVNTDKPVLRQYPPLCDEIGSMTSQMEHTLLVNDFGIEVVTRGSDY